MSEHVVDNLIVQMGLDAAGVKQGVSQMESTLQTGLKGIMRNFVAPLTAALAAGKIFGTYTRQADSVAKFARSIDVSAEKLQAWGHAATIAGGSAEGLQGSIRSLQRRISMANVGGQGSNIFEKYGIQLKDATGKTKDAFQILEELAQKAETMSKADFMGMATMLRIDQGTIQLLQSGSAEVAKLVGETKDLGFYTEQDMKAAEEYNDAVTRFQRATQIAGSSVFSALLPPITTLINKISLAVGWLNKHRNVLRGAVAVLIPILTVGLIPAILKATKAMTGLFGLKLPKDGGLAKLAALASIVGLLFDDFIVWTKGGKTAFAGFWETFGTVDEVRQKIANLKDEFDKFKAKLQGLAPVVMKVALAIMSIMAVMEVVAMTQKLISTIANVIGILQTLSPIMLAVSKGALGLIVTLTKLAVTILSAIIPAVVSFTVALLSCPLTWIALAIVGVAAALVLLAKNWDKVRAKWEQFKDALKITAILQAWTETISEWFGSLKDKFIQLWGDVVDTVKGMVPDWLQKLMTKGVNIVGAVRGKAKGLKDAVSAGIENQNSQIDTAVKATADAPTQALGRANISSRVDNSMQIGINTMYVKADNAEEFQQSMSKTAKKRTRRGDNIDQLGKQVATGQYTK